VNEELEKRFAFPGTAKGPFSCTHAAMLHGAPAMLETEEEIPNGRILKLQLKSLKSATFVE